MDNLNLFIPITKVDVENRLVYGRIAEETPDSGGEIFDYDTSKPNFQKWSEFFEKATDGKSYGNVRVQHDPKRNAGHLTDIAMLDDEKAIDVCAKVNDEDEWARTLDGDYTGFSIGGKYGKKWKDGKFTRYTAEPNEVSIVDYPMNKNCTFQLVKADGTQEPHAFKDKNIAPAKKGEPQEKMTKAEILADLKKWAGEEVYDAANAISALQTIIYLFTQEETEGESDQTAALKTVITSLKAFIASEIAENEPGDVIRRFQKLDAEKMQKFLDDASLEKKGAAISAHNLTKVQAIHDHAADMGAKCNKEAADPAGDMQKVAGERDDALAKVTALTTENETLKASTADTLKVIGDLKIERKDDDTIGTVITKMHEEITKLKAEPAPPKGVTKTVTKADDNVPDPLQKKDDVITVDPNDPKSVEAAAQAMIKAAHGNPQRFEMRKPLLSPEDLKIEAEPK